MKLSSEGTTLVGIWVKGVTWLFVVSLRLISLDVNGVDLISSVTVLRVVVVWKISSSVWVTRDVSVAVGVGLDGGVNVLTIWDNGRGRDLVEGVVHPTVPSEGKEEEKKEKKIRSEMEK